MLNFYDVLGTISRISSTTYFIKSANVHSPSWLRLFLGVRKDEKQSAPVHAPEGGGVKKHSKMFVFNLNEPSIFWKHGPPQ